jgi:transcriptional regulator with GAF, ATPase, and Fis domain
MKPIPETTEAVEEYGPFAHDGTLLEQLNEKAQQVLAIVPDCVGLSVASTTDGVTFTLVASDEEIGLLDALQYLSGGPCVAGVEGEQVLAYRRKELFDETDWQLFAQGTAAFGVASTLSLPILADMKVVGSVNLYGASNNAFTGHHHDLARIFDAWAPGAVTNADLSFSTRRTAEQAVEHLRGTFRIEVAVGIIADREALDPAAARTLLEESARRAGVSTAQLAETYIELNGLEGSP